MGYTKTALKGISWMSSFRVITRILSFAKIAVLARVLTPSQFGVFGIASLVLALLEILTETGINIILIQVKKDIKEYLDSAWVVSIIRGIVIFLLIIISSPFIASFFKTPEALGILLLISLVPLIRGFINPAEVKFQKELNFMYEFWFRAVLFFVDAAVAIILGIITHSVYSLVFGLLAGAILEVIISFVLIKPIPKFKFRMDYLKEIFHKGKWITAYGIFNYFGENGDNIVVGKLLGASSLGIYQMAYKISMLPITEVSNVVNQVIFPVYTKIEQDVARLQRAFTKTMLITIILSVLVGGFLYIFSSEVVRVVLGSQWLSVIPVLKVLAIYGILRAITGPSSALFLSRGRQEYVTVMIFVRFLALIITIYPLVMLFGMVGAGYSALISVLVEIPVIVLLIVRLFNK
ncbi:MAG: lipopolysaccharide biosynthesis protein [Candidatus Levybacteria bacterium]|nr:lipopolysaccharide biosynthesis protein [Candidatus Levybacteria bacterium]